MIKENLVKVRSTLSDGVRLVAVSKTKPVEMLQEAYDAGQRLFGENKALEMRDKHAVLPQDIEWHFIGHLQTNKIKYIAEYVSLIHSIDSLHLLEAVDKEAEKHDRVIDCLLQVHVAKEETKFGFLPEELREMLDEGEWKELKHVRIRGLMCMATNTDDEAQIHGEFREVKELFEAVKMRHFSTNEAFSELSMGMSDDYRIAIDEGSTMIRVGSRIFGARNY